MGIFKRNLLVMLLTLSDLFFLSSSSLQITFYSSLTGFTALVDSYLDTGLDEPVFTFGGNSCPGWDGDDHNVDPDRHVQQYKEPTLFHLVTSRCI